MNLSWSWTCVFMSTIERQFFVHRVELHVTATFHVLKWLSPRQLEELLVIPLSQWQRGNFPGFSTREISRTLFSSVLHTCEKFGKFPGWPLSHFNKHTSMKYRSILWQIYLQQCCQRLLYLSRMILYRHIAYRPIYCFSSCVEIVVLQISIEISWLGTEHFMVFWFFTKLIL